jgi:hypothetical protein
MPPGYAAIALIWAFIVALVVSRLCWTWPESLILRLRRRWLYWQIDRTRRRLRRLERKW